MHELHLKSPHLMAAVWKSVKDYDIDKNGFIQCSELEHCFKEQWPVELEGKSLVYYFRQFASHHDKNLVNYRGVKKQIYDSCVASESKTDQRNLTPNPSHAVLAKIKSEMKPLVSERQTEEI